MFKYYNVNKTKNNIAKKIMLQYVVVSAISKCPIQQKYKKIIIPLKLCFCKQEKRTNLRLSADLK